MSEIRELILDAAKSVLEGHCTHKVLDDAQNGIYAAALWSAMEETGIPWMVVPEAQGGSGLSVQDAGALIQQAAYYAAPVPLCETVMATWFLNAAGMELVTGALTIGFAAADSSCRLEQVRNGWRIRGKVPGVPWAGQAVAVILVVEQAAGVFVVLLPAGGFSINRGINLAGEPRNAIEVDLHLSEDAVRKIPDIAFSTAYEFGAALRTAQISGALQRVLELSVSYTMDRKQFGRPLAKFQAVQNNLAILASQAAAANGAAELALSVATRKQTTVAVASAKARASEAATVGAAIAHQVHGAMGLTSEYVLRHYTQRLWSWRDEFGSESFWWSKLGASMLMKGADSYWQAVCEVDDMVASSISESR